MKRKTDGIERHEVGHLDVESEGSKVVTLSSKDVVLVADKCISRVIDGKGASNFGNAGGSHVAETAYNTHSGYCAFAWSHLRSILHQFSTLAKNLAALTLFTALPTPTVFGQPIEDLKHPETSRLANTDEPKTKDLNNHPVVDHVHSFYRMVLAVLPPLIILIGLTVSVWNLRATETPSARQDFLWLMTFATSISWWVASATANGPSDGQSISISTWSTLFAVYEAKCYRSLRDSKLHLFISLLGGLIVAMIVGGVATEASGQVYNGNNAMENFVQHAVTVGPTMVTLWTCCVTFGLRSRGRDLDRPASSIPEAEGDVELGDLQP